MKKHLLNHPNPDEVSDQVSELVSKYVPKAHKEHLKSSVCEQCGWTSRSIDAKGLHIHS